MQLLMCVINDPSKVDDILQAFLEIGITGATIIDSYGMGKILVQDIPIFAGFRSMLSGGTNYNKTIFSLVEDEQKVQDAVKAVEIITGDLDSPASGIIFSIPVNFVKGLVPES